MNELTQNNKRSGWYFVPSLYIAEGLPFIIINSVIVVLYKRLGLPNEIIAFWTGWLTLPWAIKLLWGPIIDIYLTKKKWIVITQTLITLLFIIISKTLNLENFFYYSIITFGLIALTSATQDIAIDGYYLVSLDKTDQAFFVGIRTTFYRIAMILGSGLLVYIAGKLEKISSNDISNNPYTPFLERLTSFLGYQVISYKDAWIFIFYFIAFLFGFFTIYHLYILPEVENNNTNKSNSNINSNTDINDSYKQEIYNFASFKAAFYTFFSHSYSIRAISFILLYRVAENLLIKIASPFMLDPINKGGLGLSTDEVGIIYGTIGLLCVIFGGIAGGYLVSKYGFQRTIWFLAISLNIPDILYIFMAYYNEVIPKYLIYTFVAIEQLGFGLGTTAFVVYIVYISDGIYKSSHYAIATGLMALGNSLSSSVSGYIQKYLGYTNFFIFICICTILSFISVFLIINDPRIPKKEAQQT